MNDRERHSELSDAELDRLLRVARWPQASDGAERRLAQFWRSLRRTASSSPYWALAAGVLIAFGVWGAWRHVWRTPTSTAVHIGAPLAPQQVEDAGPSKTKLIIARAPTPLELAMLRSAERQARKPNKNATASAGELIARAVTLMEAGSDEEAQRMVGPIDQRELNATLMQMSRTSGPLRRQAVARLVASIATPQSLPLLLELDRSPQTLDPAVAGLARVAPPQMLAELARTHPSPAHRRQLMTGLLQRDGPEMATSYLALVQDPATAEGALASLDDVRPATEPFFARLDDAHVSVREAAARVLGRIDGPKTTERLVAMARRNRNRREALIALADSRGSEAKRFLQINQSSGPLAGAIRSVLLQQEQQ